MVLLSNLTTKEAVMALYGLLSATYVVTAYLARYHDRAVWGCYCAISLIYAILATMR